MDPDKWQIKFHWADEQAEIPLDPAKVAAMRGAFKHAQVGSG